MLFAGRPLPAGRSPALGADRARRPQRGREGDRGAARRRSRHATRPRRGGLSQERRRDWRTAQAGRSRVGAAGRGSFGAAFAAGAHAMSARVCGRCRRPLPAPSEGGAPAPCPFCAAQDAGRAGGGRAAQSRPTADVGAPKKRAEAFASALSENAGRTTPVHSFAVPPEAIPLVQQRKREAPPAPTPPPVVLAPPPAPVVTILPPAAAPAREPPPAPPPRRAAAVTATLASLGPGPFTAQSRPAPAAPVIVASQASPAVIAAPAAVA